MTRGISLEMFSPRKFTLPLHKKCVKIPKINALYINECPVMKVFSKS